MYTIYGVWYFGVCTLFSRLPEIKHQKTKEKDNKSERILGRRQQKHCRIAETLLFKFFVLKNVSILILSRDNRCNEMEKLTRPIHKNVHELIDWIS